MKKRSILLTCIAALMALAMFVGCDNGPVYPAWPTGGTLTQKVDLIEGQIIPSNAFDAVVTYTDGTSKTIKNVAVTGSNGIAVNGTEVSVEVGRNYQDTAIKAKGNIVAIPVDHIEATVAEDAQFVYTEDEGVYTQIPAGKETVVVSAVTADGLSYTLSQADYVVVGLEADTANIEDDAETVEAKLVVTALGENHNDFITRVDVVAGIDRTPDEPFYSVSTSSTFKIAPFAYGEGELPEITFENVAVKGFYGEQSGSPVDVTVDPGLEFSGLLDARTKLPIKTTDLTTITNPADLTFAIDYADNKTVYGTVTYADVNVEIEYIGDGLYVGDALPSADQFEVLVSVDGIYEEITPEDGSLVFYTWDAEKEGYAEYKGTTIPEGGVSVLYNYRGIDSDNLAYVFDKASTVVEAVNFTLKEDAVGPAKQIHTKAPVFDVNDIASVTMITSTDGNRETIKVPAPYDGFTFAYSTTPSKVTAFKDGVDLSAAESVYVIATYKAGNVEKVDTQTIATSAPAKANDIVLSTNDYDATVGSKIEWTIALANDEGIIEYLHKDAYDNPVYTVWVDGNSTDIELATEVTAKAQGPYYVTYGELESNRVSIEAGGGYVTPAEEGGFKVSLTAVKPMIGNPVSGNAADYSVDEDSWTPAATGETPEPKVYSIRKAATDQKYEATSTVYARVSYVDSTGETKISDEIAVEIKGIGWTDSESVVLVNANYPEIAAGNTYTDETYSYGDFGASGTQHGKDNLLCVVGWYSGSEWDGEESSLQKTDITPYGWDRTVNFVVRYTNADGVVAYKTFPLTNIQRPAETN